MDFFLLIFQGLLPPAPFKGLSPASLPSPLFSKENEKLETVETEFLFSAFSGRNNSMWTCLHASTAPAASQKRCEVRLEVLGLWGDYSNRRNPAAAPQEMALRDTLVLEL